jgi:lipoprotein-anchoring transpeptidase ErfK/SrfK
MLLLFALAAHAQPDALVVLPADRADTARVQIQLSRTPFQPGVIDGAPGDNTTVAVTAFQRAHQLPDTGLLDDPTRAALAEAAGPLPLTDDYTVTADDVKGPFSHIPHKLYAAHTLDCMCYRSPWERLAEKFQSSPRFLAELNPGVDLAHVRRGTALVVPDPTSNVPLDRPVADIRIDVVNRTLTAFADDGTLLRQYPTVVGPDFAAYRGTLTVASVTKNPEYTLDPKIFKEIPHDLPKVVLPPGPNSPVGVVWIGLSKEGYGIHGTSSPGSIGHTESHGCVRLTNWSALELSEQVQKDVTRVDFVGTEQG